MLVNLMRRAGALPEDGIIGVAESGTDAVPFDIKRVYYIYAASAGTIRGHHAHKKLKQVLICTYGKIEITTDNGRGKIESTILEDPSVGTYVGPDTWRTMKWLKNDSVLLVLASEHYNESDYIRNYGEFKAWIKIK